MSNPNTPDNHDALLDSLAANLKNLTPEQLTRLAQLGESAKIAATTRSKGNGILSSAYRTPGIVSPAIISSESPEFRELAEQLRLEEGYAREMEKQRTFQLLSVGEKAPNFSQVMKAFTPEMLVAAQGFQNPMLTFSTKGRSFNDLVAAMDAHKTIPDQEDAYVSGIYNDDQAERPLETWGAYIVDGPREMDVIRDFDDETLILRERLKRFADYKKANGLKGMDRWKYAQLMMQAIKNGRPLDHDWTWTMLDSDPALSTSLVPFAFWSPSNRRVNFDSGHPGYGYGGVRLRRSVGGDVPNA